MNIYNPLLKYVFDTPTIASNYTKDRLPDNKYLYTTYKIDFQFKFYIKNKFNQIVDPLTLDRKDIDEKKIEYVKFKGNDTFYYTLYGRLKQIIVNFKAKWYDNPRFKIDFIFFCHELLDVPLRRYLYENIRWANESTREKVIKRRDAMKEILYPKKMRERDANERAEAQAKVEEAEAQANAEAKKKEDQPKKQKKKRGFLSSFFSSSKKEDNKLQLKF